jgi:anti-sigma factor RsiW
MSPNRPASVEHPIEMISAYMDGRLEAEDRARVHEHLRDCAACQRILADFRALAAAARREEAPPVPSDLVERIGRRINAEPAARSVHRWRFVPRARLPFATAAAVLVLASLWVVWRGRLPGERLAESQSDVAPPTSVPLPEQAPSPQPGPVSAPASDPDGPRRVQPGVAGNLDPFGDVSRRQDAGREAVGGPAFAPSPPAPPPPMAGKPHIKKEGAALAGAPADQEENKMSAALSREAIPAPEENSDRADTATGGSQGGSGPLGLAVAPSMAGMAKSADTASMTLVFIMPEARVSVLPDSRIVLTSGDYICALPAGGPEEDKALAELRALASRRSRPTGFTPAEGQVAEPGSREMAMPRELVIPAPPGSGPLASDVAAEMHRRLRILVRQRILARAETECGPIPPTLQQIR